MSDRSYTCFGDSAFFPLKKGVLKAILVTSPTIGGQQKKVIVGGNANRPIPSLSGIVVTDWIFSVTPEPTGTFQPLYISALNVPLREDLQIVVWADPNDEITLFVSE